MWNKFYLPLIMTHLSSEFMQNFAKGKSCLNLPPNQTSTDTKYV